MSTPAVFPASLSSSLNPTKHQRSLEPGARPDLIYINLAIDRKQRAYSLVRELYHFTTSRLQRRNASIMAALSASPSFTVGSWALGYNSVFIRKGAEKDTCRRRSSLSTGTGPLGPSPWVRRPPATLPTTAPYRTSYSSWTYHPIFPDGTAIPGSPSNEVILAGATNKTPPTSSSNCLWISQPTVSPPQPPSLGSTTLRSTASHHHRSASRSRSSRSPDCNSYSAEAWLLPLRTRPAGPDF